MADNILCLIGAMERLWFHQIILFSEPIFSVPKTLKPHKSNLESPTSPSSSGLSFSSLPDEENASPTMSPSQHEGNSDDFNTADQVKENKNQKERPTRLSLSTSRSRSHSSSPPTQKRNQRDHRYSSSSASVGKLQKSMSCRSLRELELEEVKGFMDLGFIFQKESVNRRMMSVIPGLQRLGFYKTKENTQLNKEINQEEEERGAMRPYLSEAWLIKRPDSPLLNLRLPRVSAASDMKKHLRFWARTVASVVQLEC